MPAFRFLQVSDLHLGAPFGRLAPEARAERRREQQRVLDAVVERAVERQADAILIPGDLFDAEGVDAATLAFAVHAFRVSGCPPVFIAPGNHDPSTTSSPYWNPRLLGARGWSWPDHVHVFRTAEWSPARIEGRPVTVWGRCFVNNAPTFERPLAPATVAATGPLDPEHLHVAVFHGSNEAACPPWQKVTAPFSEDEARRAPFAYMAVGHLHQPSSVAAASDDEAARGVRLAYAGSPVALGYQEVGAHGALEVRIETGDGAPSVTIEPVTLDSRRAHVVDVDVTGASSADAIDARIRAVLDDSSIAERDLVTVRLQGRIVHGVRYPGPAADLLGRAFALRVDVRALRPDYDLEGLRAREPSTTEDRFVHALMDHLDAETSPERRALILAALYYGLDAFRLGEVVPAYEEIGA